MDLNLEKFNKLPIRNGKSLLVFVQKAIDLCTSREDRMEVLVKGFSTSAIKEVQEVLEKSGFHFHYRDPIYPEGAKIIFYAQL
jgi:hypothetical protein